MIRGGVAIRDVNSDPVKTLGSFLREYIDAIIGGKEINAENYIHVYRLGEEEGAENVISSHPKGCEYG